MSEPVSRPPVGDAERYRTLLDITNALVLMLRDVEEL